MDGIVVIAIGSLLLSWLLAIVNWSDRPADIGCDAAKLDTSLLFGGLHYCNAVLAGLPIHHNTTATSSERLGPSCGASWATWSRHHYFEDRHWLPIEQRIVFKLCLPMHQVHTGPCQDELHVICEAVTASADMTSSPRLRCTNERTAAHASEVWRTFIFLCRTKSLEQSALIAERTNRYWHF